MKQGNSGGKREKNLNLVDEETGETPFEEVGDEFDPDAEFF